MSTQHYSSKIEWWFYALLILSILGFIAVFLSAGMDWWIVLILSIPLIGLIVICCFNISYFIKEDILIVQTMSGVYSYPIENIKEVRKVKSILVAPAMSFTRVVIKFERGTTKTAVPLEISPKDRDKFIQDLLKINPNIKVIS